MELDIDRIDAAVLALLLLGLHDGCRVWKTFDWDVMNRLHEKGFISNPIGKAKLSYSLRKVSVRRSICFRLCSPRADDRLG